MKREVGRTAGTLVVLAWLVGMTVLWSAMSAASSAAIMAEGRSPASAATAVRIEFALSSERDIRRALDIAGQDGLAADIERAFGVPGGRLERLMGPLHASARTAGVPVELYAALVMTESSFRAEARSHAGAIGPAQVMPRWWARGLCSDMDLHAPADNLHCGARVLAQYHHECDADWACALWRYNVGPGALARDEPGARDAARRYEAKVAGWLRKLGDAGRSL